MGEALYWGIAHFCNSDKGVTYHGLETKYCSC